MHLGVGSINSTFNAYGQSDSPNNLFNIVSEWPFRQTRFQILFFHAFLQSLIVKKETWWSYLIFVFSYCCSAQRDSSAGGVNNKQEEEKAITGLLDGSGEYTLVYEDNEGDRMLVGDVPWQ